MIDEALGGLRPGSVSCGTVMDAAEMVGVDSILLLSKAMGFLLWIEWVEKLRREAATKACGIADLHRDAS